MQPMLNPTDFDSRRFTVQDPRSRELPRHRLLAEVERLIKPDGHGSTASVAKKLTMYLASIISHDSPSFISHSPGSVIRCRIVRKVPINSRGAIACRGDNTVSVEN
jgi:hypothetical protein